MRYREIEAASSRLKRLCVSKLANLPVSSVKLALLVALSVLSVANPATANSAIVINGGNFVSINASDPTNPFGGLYNLAPNQGEIDPLMTFTLSPYTGQIESDGSLTITDSQLCCFFSPENNLSTSLSLYALTAAYDPSTANWNSVTASGYPTAANLLDTEAYTINGYTTQQPVTFTIPEAVLQGWVNSPSSNFGVVIIESNSWSGDQGHSDIPYITSGPGSPTLSFNATPEPSSVALIVVGLAGFRFMRRRRLAASF
jgi:hypothetical protein